MSPSDIIELLSSDNEGQLPLPRSAVSKATTTQQAESDFHYLSDDLGNSLSQSQDWPVSPAKRRKLSSSPDFEDGTRDPLTLPTKERKQPPHRTVSQTEQSESVATAVLDRSDPITFTSSLGATASRAKKRAVAQSLSDSDLSDDSLPSDLLSATALSKPSGLSARTAALLDSLSQPPPRPKPPDVRKTSKSIPSRLPKERSRASDHGQESASDDDRATAPTKSTKASKKPRLTEEEKAAKAQKKEQEKVMKTKEREKVKMASKEQKAKEREEEQENKRVIKEQKAREKRIAADLAEVNKSKLDKKDSTPEMIVDLPASIDGQKVHTQTREILRNLGVDTTLYQSPIPNVVKLRRKMKARWNTALDHWEPLDQMEIHDEKHVLCLMSANDFIALAMVQDGDQDIETHVARLKSAFEDCTPIYLIEGLHLSMRKNKTAENRAYQEKVNSTAQANDQPSSNHPASKKRKPTPEIVDEDMIEDALLRLQVMNGCLVHHTNAPVETAEWIANFTQHISTIPYRSNPPPPHYKFHNC